MTVMFPRKIMVWGAVSAHGTSHLNIVDGSMNQQKCIEVLRTCVISQIREWYGHRQWFFQDDTATCFTATCLKKWCTEDNDKLLPGHENYNTRTPLRVLVHFERRDIKCQLRPKNHIFTALFNSIPKKSRNNTRN